MNMIAIDPGLQGAICLYLPEEGYIEIYDMPTKPKPQKVKKRGKPVKQKNIIDMQGLCDLVKELNKKYSLTYTILEEQIVMPRQGGVSNFTTGHNYGVLKMAAVANGLIIKEVRAAEWKERLNVPADKTLAIERANSLVPVGAPFWEPQKQRKGENNSLAQRSGRAEAAMLAIYGAAYLINQPEK